MKLYNLHLCYINVIALAPAKRGYYHTYQGLCQLPGGCGEPMDPSVSLLAP